MQSLVLAIVLIYAILASQFRSFLQPFAIMLSLPLSLVGVAGMLYLVHDTLNMMSMIGVILLMGLVTKNAILVVDFANVQRREGMGARRGADRRGARAAAADPHDHAGHDLRHAAAGVRDRAPARSSARPWRARSSAG